MKLLTPKHVFKNVAHITPEFLRAQGIKGLVLDVDNTLTGHGSQKLPKIVENWLNQMRAEGFKMMIASNNFKTRVAPFAKQIGVDYVSFCCKPLPKWLRVATRKWGFKKSEIVIIGDQLFTDILGGNAAGVKTLLVRPMYEDIKISIRFKRKLEKVVLMRYYENGGNIL